MGLGNKFFQAISRLMPSQQIWVDGSRSESYTPTGAIDFPFKTVQAGHDYAASLPGRSVVHIQPSVYNENVVITGARINIKGANSSGPHSDATINGSIRIIDTTVTVISGLTINSSTDLNHCLSVEGSAGQKLFVYNCSIRSDSPGAHHAVSVTDSGDTEVNMRDCIIRHGDISGGGRAYLASAVTNGVHRFYKTNFLLNNNNQIAIEALGSANLEINGEDCQGQIVVGGSVLFDIENLRITTVNQPLLTTTSSAAIRGRFVGNQLLSLANPSVAGTGGINHSKTTYELVAGGFAGTLNLAITPWDGARNVIYDPSSSIYPFTSTNVQDALDEIAAAVAGGDTDELEFGNRTIQSSTTTRYLDAGITNAGAPPFIVQRPANKAGTLQGLVMRHNTPAGNGSPINYTVFVNGVATAITTTLLSIDSAGSDLVNSVVVVATDLIAIEVKKGASVGSSPIDVTGYLEIV